MPISDLLTGEYLSPKPIKTKMDYIQFKRLKMTEYYFRRHYESKAKNFVFERSKTPDVPKFFILYN